MSIFGTKAETLKRVRPLVTKSVVPDLLHFTTSDFRTSESTIIARIQERFTGRSLAIRSSAFNEDSAAQSMAGAFKSCLDVSSADTFAIRTAVAEVMAS